MDKVEKYIRELSYEWFTPYVSQFEKRKQFRALVALAIKEHEKKGGVMDQSGLANWTCKCGRHASIEHSVGGYCKSKQIIEDLEKERDAWRKDAQRFYSAAKGLSFGTDWNKGTHALTHGYRQKLLDAVMAHEKLVEGK